MQHELTRSKNERAVTFLALAQFLIGLMSSQFCRAVAKNVIVFRRINHAQFGDPTISANQNRLLLII